MRAFRLPLILVLTSLAGCASQPSPAPSPLPSPPVAQQPPEPEPSFTQTGLASFYGRAHDGKITASGESFNPEVLPRHTAPLPWAAGCG